MKKVFIAMVVLLLSITCFQQIATASWNQITISQNINFYAIDYVNADEIWAGGSNGQLIMIAEPNETISYHNLNVSSRVTSICFPKANNSDGIGYLCGHNGIIFKKTNEDWSALTSGTTQDLYGIHFNNPTNGIAVGNNRTILYTTNGGVTWQNSTIPTTVSTQSRFYSVKYIAANTAITISHQGIVLKTTDNGATWTEGFAGGFSIRDIFFRTQNHGFAVGSSVSNELSGVLLETTDGGLNWNPLSYGSTSNLLTIYFSDIDLGRGFVAGSSGIMSYKASLNQGWQVVSSPTNSTIYGLIFTSQQVGYAVGFNGLLLKTTNGGDPNAPFLRIDMPIESSTFIEGNTHTISIAHRNISRIKIEYSTNSGYNWLTVENSRNISGTSTNYSWTVPFTPSEFCRIRVSELLENDEEGISVQSQTFKIMGKSINVTKPIPSDKWKRGRNVTVEWTSQMLGTALVKVEYFDGNSWIRPNENEIPAQNGTYTFSLPGTGNITNSALVRVTELGSLNPTIGLMPSAFSIVLPFLLITDVASDNFFTGGQAQVNWVFEEVNTVNLFYRIDAESSWVQINSTPIPASYGEYIWNPLPILNTTSNSVSLKIEDATDDLVSNVSSVFSIIVPTINLINPSVANLRFQRGKNCTINWQSTMLDGSKIKIELIKPPSYSLTIAENIPIEDGSFSWEIPNNQNESINYKIRITNDTEPSFSKESNNDFWITDIKFSMPEGFVLYRNYNNTIQWSNLLNANVKIEWRSLNGTQWNEIVAATTATSCQWNVPTGVPDNIVLRVSQIDYPDIFDTFEANVRTAKLSLIFPTKGESWKSGVSKNILWVAENVANIRIIAKRISPTTLNDTLTHSLDASIGSFSWTAPSNGVYKIRIESTINSNIFDESNLQFTVSNSYITVISPNGAEKWMSRSNINNILYECSADITHINLHLSTDGGSTWQASPIGSAIPISTGNIFANWQIPNLPTKNARIKIEDTHNLNINDITDEDFTIIGLKLNKPVAKAFLMGSELRVEWKAVEVSSIKIEYTTNSGTNWLTIEDDYPASVGYYTWIVPNELSKTCRIRIRDNFRSSIWDLSEAFEITGLVMTSPAGGEEWLVGSKQKIKWNAVNVGNLKIEYNAGTGWVTEMAQVASNPNEYEWTIPKYPSNEVYVRLTTLSEPEFIVVNENPFKIIGTGIFVLAPLAGNDWQMGTEKEIKWYSSEVINVNIEFSTNNGKTWTTIASQINASLASLNWTVPVMSKGTTEGLIKITDSDNPDIYHISDKFKISGASFRPPVRWTFHSPTQDNSTIIIPSSINPFDDRVIDAADAIGVFFQRDGEWVCAGYSFWNATQNHSITVWADDIKTSIKDGYSLNEIYVYMVWDAVKGIEYFATPTYSSGFPYFTPDGISVLSNLNSHQRMMIPIRQGWSLISANKQAQNPNVELLMQNVATNLDIMKNQEAEVYIPATSNPLNYVNTIKNWNIRHGYQVYMTQADTLYFSGAYVNPADFPIHLTPNKWFIISFLPKAQMAIQTVFATSGMYLLMVKNTFGEVYYPDYNVNQFEYMRPGEGYKVITRYSSTLTYPNDPIGPPIIRQQEQYANNLSTNLHFNIAYEKTGNSSFIVLESQTIPDGYEVGIINSDGMVIGAGVFADGQASATVWGDNSQTPLVTEGAKSGEILDFRIFDPATQIEYELNISEHIDLINGRKHSAKIKYAEDRIWLAKIGQENYLTVKNLSLSNDNIKCEPNPASDFARIKFFTEQESNVKIELFNSIGSRINTIFNDRILAGTHYTELNTVALESGAYYLKMTSGSSVVIEKLLIVK